MTSALPARGLLLVRPVETDETLPGGRILLTPTARERMTSAQCEVIALGAPALCDPDDNEDCERAHVYELCNDCAWNGGSGDVQGHCGCQKRVHPCVIVAGAWLLVIPRSFIAGPKPERAEWYVHQDAVLAILSEDTT